VFKSVPANERGNRAVYDTRGIWGDQTLERRRAGDLRIAG
jgi:hypothetical protein